MEFALVKLIDDNLYLSIKKSYLKKTKGKETFSFCVSNLETNLKKSRKIIYCTIIAYNGKYKILFIIKIAN